MVPFDSSHRWYSNVDERTLYHRLLFTELICLVTFITRPRKTTFSIFVRKTSTLSTTRHSHFLSLFFFLVAHSWNAHGPSWRQIVADGGSYKIASAITGLVFYETIGALLSSIDYYVFFFLFFFVCLTNFSSEKTFSLVSLSHRQTEKVNTKVN